MLTQKELKEKLHYSKKTGLFTWRVVRGRKVKPGDRAGGSDSDGYITIGIGGKAYFAHRLACLYVKGYFPEHDIDHEDRIRHNNKWKNLRETTRQCNLRNTGLRKNNTSGIKGVHWLKQSSKWQSRICVNGKQGHLGLHETKRQAAFARLNAEVEYDFPDCCNDSSAYEYLFK